MTRRPREYILQGRCCVLVRPHARSDPASGGCQITACPKGGGHLMLTCGSNAPIGIEHRQAQSGWWNRKTKPRLSAVLTPVDRTSG
jgi:hypothetical protein